MEAKTIEAQVQHLVRQLEKPCVFSERILVIDSKEDGFLRQYTNAYPTLLLDACQGLLEAGWVDRIVLGPNDPVDIRSLNHRWFGINSSQTHTSSGVQVASFLKGLEACSGDYVLHVDSDVLICRCDVQHDYIREILAVMDRDPLGVTVGFNVANELDLPYTCGGASGPWRVESRAGLVHRARIFSGRPYPNCDLNGGLELSWYRSLDRAVQSGQWRSYRGGGGGSCFVHPPNRFKADADAWLLLVDRAEKTGFPSAQIGHSDLQGGVDAWLTPKRYEPFVFVVCGRDIIPGRFWRCINSLLEQSRQDWGAVVVDDNSGECSAGFVEALLSRWPDRFTLVRPRLRRGSLANTVLAVRHFCANPDSVIVTLDADDTLLGPSVLDRVAAEYAKGADVTVGSMLRTDRHKQYVPDFEHPRAKRGGNVWQHLRTFKKSLFDQIPDRDLRLNGEYIGVAADWAYMLPIVEMALHPAYIPAPLYLYEPSDSSAVRRASRRLPNIKHLVAQPECTPSLAVPHAAANHNRLRI
jgi:glycosyltransferase involved in cell wall biosynthesis